MSESNPKQRWYRFSLKTLLLITTVVGLYLGWRGRVTEEEKALGQVRSKLDDVYFDWQQPELKKMAPVRPAYTTGVKLPDGMTRTETRYHDSSYALVESGGAKRPEPDWLERLMDRQPRMHVVGVELPDYNVKDEVLAQLQKFPHLKHVLVRNVHEPDDGPTPPVLEQVREALPDANVVGQTWRLHPKNRQ